MRRRLFGPLVAVACTVGMLGGAAPGGAAPVLVLENGGHTVMRQNRFLPAATLTPAPRRAVSLRAARRARAAASQVTIATTLAGQYHRGEISASEYAGDHATLEAAIRTAARLRGTRAVELYSVLTNMHRMAVAGELTPSRLPALFLTLEHNRQWRSTGPLLTYGQRVQFSGSQLV